MTLDKGKSSMASADFVKRLSQLLEIPVRVIRAYLGPVRVRVAAKRVKEPPAAGNRKRQNELYKQWHDANEGDKPLVAEALFEEVQKHARNIVWKKIPELAYSNLSREMASVVIEKLGKFRGRGKAGRPVQFTTWAHRIILNLANLELRKRVKNRERFVEYDPENPDPDLVKYGVADAIEQMENRMVVERMKKELPGEECGLLECMLGDMTAGKIAEKFGIPEDNVESRWRRLKQKLKEKFASARRKMTGSGN